MVLRGDDSRGEFHSIAVSNHFQQADTGTKMIHLGRNTKSRIVSKGISAGHAHNSYRGLVRITPTAQGAHNHTQCDSLLIGPDCGAHTFPYIDTARSDAVVEHEATTTRISEERLFYCQQRGIDPQEATALIVGVLPGRPRRTAHGICPGSQGPAGGVAGRRRGLTDKLSIKTASSAYSISAGSYQINRQDLR